MYVHLQKTLDIYESGLVAARVHSPSYLSVTIKSLSAECRRLINHGGCGREHGCTSLHVNLDRKCERHSVHGPCRSAQKHQSPSASISLHWSETCCSCSALLCLRSRQNSCAGSVEVDHSHAMYVSMSASSHRCSRVSSVETPRLRCCQAASRAFFSRPPSYSLLRLRPSGRPVYTPAGAHKGGDDKGGEALCSCHGKISYVVSQHKRAS